VNCLLKKPDFTYSRKKVCFPSKESIALGSPKALTPDSTSAKYKASHPRPLLRVPDEQLERTASKWKKNHAKSDVVFQQLVFSGDSSFHRELKLQSKMAHDTLQPGFSSFGELVLVDSH
jgi:hypothetical protein